MAMSLTALVLSALSATSCAFVKFDHQYDESGSGGDSGRSLVVSLFVADSQQSVGNDERRKLPESSAIPDDNGESFVDTATTTIPTIAWLPGDTNGTTASIHSPAASPSTHHSSSTMPTHKGSHKNNSSSGGQTASSSSAASSTSTAAAAAQVKGEAGLFCDGQLSTFTSSLWGESSVSDFEDKIATESNDDQSEELARNAVLAALVIGAFTFFVALVECILGWRVWCDKLLVGLLAFMACVSQGVTFLFFDSERYW